MRGSVIVACVLGLVHASGCAIDSEGVGPVDDSPTRTPRGWPKNGMTIGEAEAGAADFTAQLGRTEAVQSELARGQTNLANHVVLLTDYWSDEWQAEEKSSVFAMLLAMTVMGNGKTGVAWADETVVMATGSGEALAYGDICICLPLSNEPEGIACETTSLRYVPIGGFRYGLNAANGRFEFKNAGLQRPLAGRFLHNMAANSWFGTTFFFTGQGPAMNYVPGSIEGEGRAIVAVLFGNGLPCPEPITPPPPGGSGGGGGDPPPILP